MATARLNREYALRLCGVGAIMVGLSVWSIYDGAVAWPRVNAELAAVRGELLAGCANGMTPERWLAADPEGQGTFPLREVYSAKGFDVPRHLVQELSTIVKPEGDDAQARRARAEAAAKLFGEDVYPQGKLHGQFVQAAVTLLLGLLAFRAVWSKRHIVYEVDADGLRGTGFGPSPLTWDDIKRVDWSKWEEKGIVALHDVAGRRHVLDGWHFAGVRPIAEEIEKHHPRTSKCQETTESGNGANTPNP